MGGLRCLNKKMERKRGALSLKHKAVLLLLALVTLLASGCAKGDITLDLRNIGQADVTCQVLVAPALAVPLEQVKDQFRSDQFQVAEVRDGDWVGFTAERHFDRVRDVKDIRLFQSARKPADGPPGAGGAAPDIGKPFQSEIVTEKGWFVDTYKINAQLRADQQLPLKKPEEKQLAAFLLSQVKLNFIVKLPVAPSASNAVEVRDEGRTLVWPVNLAGQTHVYAEAKLVNWPRLALVCLAALLGAAFAWRKWRAAQHPKGATRT